MYNFIFSILIITLIYGSVREIEASCDDNTEFTCDDGTCIHTYFECDGQIHCPDGSDETSKHCASQKCPKYGFRCSYGACIDLVKKCNGKQDCVDNSDESNESCRSNSPQRCPLGYFQCDNNECIDEFAVCDGAENCSDGSDESEIECKHFPCPRKLGYQCDYGACVKKNSRCDGIQDCRDGSDERNCFSLKSSNKVVTTTTKSPEGCFLPIQPDNGSYTVKDCATHEECKTIIGTKVALSTQLQYNCDEGFELSERLKVTHCTSIKGSIGWYPSQVYFFCQACGTLQGPTALIAYGDNAKPEEHPWNVGVYVMWENGTYGLICGGSIITSSLVLTAAHCVESSKIQDIKVAVGKTNRFWDINEPYEQNLDVVNKYVHSDYEKDNSQRNYAFDVALLETKKDIAFGRTAYPVCIIQDSSSISNGLKGTVVGWGKDENYKTSKNLKSVKQEFMNYAECRKKYNSQSSMFSHTTVCGLYMNQSGVKQGDSGAGFIFNIKNKHYLRGIVSTLIPTDHRVPFATYTDVTTESIYNFIRDIRVKVASTRKWKNNK